MVVRTDPYHAPFLSYSNEVRMLQDETNLNLLTNVRLPSVVDSSYEQFFESYVVSSCVQYSKFRDQFSL